MNLLVAALHLNPFPPSHFTVFKIFFILLKRKNIAYKKARKKAIREGSLPVCSYLSWLNSIAMVLLVHRSYSKSVGT